MERRLPRSRAVRRSRRTPAAMALSPHPPPRPPPAPAPPPPPPQSRPSLAEIHGAVQVRTAVRSMDLLLYRWLTYQTLACRIWARSAFYQAGGAYGFRDQLQDVMALTTAGRDVARAHLRRAAAR